MAEPARESTAGPDQDAPERRPGPRASGWADVRQMVTAAAAACRLAVEELASRPGDDRARALAGSVLAALESAAVIAGGCAVDEAVIEAERARAYAAGVADCKAARCRLRVAGGSAG